MSTTAFALHPGGGEGRPPFRFLQTARERLATLQLPGPSMRLLPPPKHVDPIMAGTLPVGRYELEVDNYALCLTGILRRAPRKVSSLN